MTKVLNVRPRTAAPPAVSATEAAPLLGRSEILVRLLEQAEKADATRRAESDARHAAAVARRARPRLYAFD